DLLHDKDDGLQAEATGALAKLGKPAIPILVEALKDDNPTRRHHAVEGLGQVGVDAANELVDALKNKNVDVRRDAARVLSPLRVSDKLVVLSFAEALAKDED